MVNQVGGGAPRLGHGASDGEIIGLNATGDRARAFTYFFPGVGAGLVAGTGVGGDARGVDGGIAGGGVAGRRVAGGGDAGGGVAEGGVVGGVTRGGVDGGKKSLTFLSSLKLKIWCFCCKQFLYDFYTLGDVSFFYWVAENMSFLPRPNRRCSESLNTHSYTTTTSILSFQLCCAYPIML
jgi:hypothetical protein